MKYPKFNIFIKAWQVYIIFINFMNVKLVKINEFILNIIFIII
jgi:hypothetical protein